MIDDCFVYVDVIVTFQDKRAHCLRYSSVVANERATRLLDCTWLPGARGYYSIL